MDDAEVARQVFTTNEDPPLYANPPLDYREIQIPEVDGTSSGLYSGTQTFIMNIISDSYEDITLYSTIPAHLSEDGDIGEYFVLDTQFDRHA
jgi:hypothetical protein